MELIFLGTGAGLPSKERNVSAIALSLLQELNSVWLFDCGEATQHQLLHTSIKPRKINKIFITHLHGDHIFGLPGFLSSRSFQGAQEDELTIYGPVGVKQFIETSLHVSGSHLTYPIVIHELKDDGKIYEDEHFTVYTKSLNHGKMLSLGFRIEEKDKIGELLVDKLRHIGIPPGPIYKQIKENEQTTLEDGRVINRNEFIGPNKLGKKIVILGDTLYVKEHRGFCENADILVHEATFEHDKSDLAKMYAHSTTTEAALLAKESEAKQLILTHISSRYQQNDSEWLREEARHIFPNTELAHDFFSYSIK